MSSSLTAAQAQKLHHAHQLLQQKQFGKALQLVDAVLAENAQLADALHLKALVLHAAGDLPQAEAAIVRAVTLSPKNSHMLNTLGTIHADQHKFQPALAALKAALEAAPENIDAWINTGVVANQARLHDMALKALEYVVAAAPGNARAWSAYGVTLKDIGRFEEAIAALTKALSLSPRDAYARYNLGVAHRLNDAPAKAQIAFEQAMADGLAGPAAPTGRAHVLAELGDYAAAIAAYRDVVAQFPDHTDAHDALARTLPQVSATEDPLASYRIALEKMPRALNLWQSALNSARELKAYEQLLAWSEAAEKNLGKNADFQLARAGALLMLGDPSQALLLVDEVLAQQPRHAGAHNFRAHILLGRKEAEQAAYHAQQAADGDPLNQSGWAYLATAWRLMADPRETWLANYDQHVLVIDLPVSADFLIELRDSLLTLHNTAHHPTEQSLRNGTQTRGLLFAKKLPAIQQLQSVLRQEIARAIAALPDDPAHPFLRRKPDLARPLMFSGSWSVKLRSTGFHVSHIHPMGWMSSALYVSLPPEVAAGSGDAGALAFGVPDATLGLDLPPRRIVQPRPGRLVLFPSFLWHGTIPFESADARLTVAFDIAGS